MLLSISMIVKNEEKNIEACLKALKKLENGLKIEIVVVDTGSEDKTVDIVREYTDKVYFHQWNNNFAEMRNISLSYCTGDWVLVVDADEVLENPKELIKLLKDKRISMYNTVAVNIDNIQKSDKEAGRVSIDRLFKRTAELKYCGEIHEQPISKGKKISSNIIFSHNGYCVEDYKLMIYKYERNEKLLLSKLKSNPNDIYILFQLAQTYGMANKREESFKYIKMAKSIWDCSNNKLSYLYVPHFLCKYFFYDGKYNKTIEYCKEAIVYDNKNIDFLYMLGYSNYSIGNYIEAEEYLSKYLKELDRLNKTENLYLKMSFFSKGMEYYAIKILLSAYYKSKKYKDVIKIYNELDEKFKEEFKYIFIETCLAINDIDLIIDLINIEKINIDKVINLIDLNIADKDEREKEKIIIGAKKLGEKCEKYINILHEDRIETIIEKDFFEEYYEWKGKILLKLIENDNSNLEIIKSLKRRDIILYTAYLLNDFNMVSILSKYSKDGVFRQDFKEIAFYESLDLLLVGCKSIAKEEYREVVIRALINKREFINRVYNKELLEVYPKEAIKTSEDLFFYRICRVFDTFRCNQLESIKDLKEIIKEFPEFKKVIEVVKEYIEIGSITNEIINEKENVLSTVESLISNGQIDDAKDVLIQLKDIIKYDDKIYSYLGIIEYISGRYDKALEYLSEAYILNNSNDEVIYNIGEVLIIIGRKNDARYYLEKALEISENNELKEAISNRLLEVN